MPLSAIAFVLRCKMKAMVLEDGTRLWSITDPITRPMLPQSHACYELQLRRAVNSRSCGLQLAAVAAGSCWLQLRLAWVRGSAGSVRRVSQLVPSVRGLRAAIHGLHHYPILAVICQAWPSVRGALRDANRGAGPRNWQ